MSVFLLVLPSAGCTVSPTPAATPGPAGPQGQQGATGQTGDRGHDADQRRTEDQRRADEQRGADEQKRADEQRRADDSARREGHDASCPAGEHWKKAASETKALAFLPWRRVRGFFVGCFRLGQVNQLVRSMEQCKLTLYQ